MTDVCAHADTKSEPCGCYWERFGRVLAARPWMGETFAWLCRSHPANWIVTAVARAAVARYRRRPPDYLRLIEEHACAAPNTAKGPNGPADMDCEFSAALLGTPEGRRRLARFLESLESLDNRVKTGLLRTWLHVGVLGALVREARFAGDRRRGVRRHYPLDAIIAPFGQCNLRCRGCYALEELGRPSASLAQLDYVIRQLNRLNVYHVLLVGSGEPFYDERSKDLLMEIARRHPQTFFSVYSNGTNILDRDLRRLKRSANLIPVLSLDGPPEVNDRRRGEGVYAKVTDTFRRMKQHGLLFGYICTVFNENCRAVVDPAFVDQMAALGCKLGYYSLFLTTDSQFGDMVLAPEEREDYFRRIHALNSAAPIPLLDIDGLEAHFGCRAKRGATVYIDAISGVVSPCVRAVRAPDSCNIYRPAHPGRLVEILESDYFEQYRRSGSPARACEAFDRAQTACCALPVAPRHEAGLVDRPVEALETLS
jgi:sulfatase maturation enzyme AslB (radical SAM superfamily)